MSDSKPREWFLNPVAGYKCEVNESGLGLSGNEIHVIEYSAYIDALKMLEEMASLLQSINVQQIVNGKAGQELRATEISVALESYRKWKGGSGE